MPVFETPKPILAKIEISVGNVQLIASDRTDTVVEVRPSDPSDESNVEAVKVTRVDYADGVLTVRGPKRLFDFSKKTRSVDVVVELPEASRAHVSISVGDCRSTGVLGETQVKNSVGHISLDRTGPLQVDTSGGDITVGEAAGDTEIATGTGQIRVGPIGGTAVIKNSNGNSEIGAVTGDLRVRASNGNIDVERAESGVEAKSANGNVRVGALVRGQATLRTSFGGIDFGIARGTAALLDIKSGFGRVHNELETTPGPETTDNRVQITAHTSHGDIAIRRA